MSQKKTKPRAKSAKAEDNTKTDASSEATIRNTPATRALRFLLGKEPYSDELAQEGSFVDDLNDLNDLNDLDQSPTELISSPISAAINPTPQLIEAQKNDPASISDQRSSLENTTIASTQRASSIIDSSQSRLTKTLSQNDKLTESQLPQSRLTESQLLASQLEKSISLPELKTQPNLLEESEQIIDIPLPQRPTPLGKTEASPININWRSVEHSRIPQVVFDEILPQLPPMTHTPYLQLLRLTLGFQRNSCHISLEAWAARCNQSLASIKRQAVILQQRGLLKKESVVFGGSARGSYFCPVIPGILNDEEAINNTNKIALDVSKNNSSQLTQSQLSTSQLTQSQLTSSYMKDHDHDLRNKKDHLEKQVMMIYQELTGNRPTLADLTAYRKIAHLGQENILVYMKQIFERSLDPIGSFAYFAKAIDKATQEQQHTRASQRRKLERIVEQVRQSRVGGRALLSDLLESIKQACVRDNVTYNNDLVNEILGVAK